MPKYRLLQYQLFKKIVTRISLKIILKMNVEIFKNVSFKNVS